VLKHAGRSQERSSTLPISSSATIQRRAVLSDACWWYLGKSSRSAPSRRSTATRSIPTRARFCRRGRSMDPRKRTQEAPIQGDPPNPSIRRRAAGSHALSLLRGCLPRGSSRRSPMRASRPSPCHMRVPGSAIRRRREYEQPSFRSRTSRSRSLRPTARSTRVNGVSFDVKRGETLGHPG